MTVTDLLATAVAVPLGGRRLELPNGSAPALGQAFDGDSALTIVGLWPFIADGEFVHVLALLVPAVSAADLLSALSVSVVRSVAAHEVLLAYELTSPRTRVVMDRRLLAHDELLFLAEPPSGYWAVDPGRLRKALGANLIW